MTFDTKPAISTGIPIAAFLLSSLILTGVALYWFLPFDFHAIMGDDLAAVLSSHNGGFGSSFIGAFTHAPSNKYRPFFDIAFRAETLLLGSDLLNYIYLNICLEVLNACLVFFICWRVSRRHCGVALAGALMFTISRFSYYNILQIFGASLEGLALFLLLAMLCAVVLAYQERKQCFLVTSVVFFFCLTLTHERFLAAIPYLFLAVWWAPISFRRPVHKYLLLAAPFVVFAFNILLKKLVFQARFLEGTGGTSIGFNPLQFIRFFRDGMLNMFGFNAGPDYLAGIHVLDAGVIGIGVGVVFTSIILSIAWIALRNHSGGSDPTEGIPPLRIIVLLAVLILSLLAVASITIRQEYRWLYSPYAVFIVLLSYLAGGIKNKRWKVGLVAALVISSVSVEMFYRLFLGRFYLITCLTTADSAKRVMVDNGLKKHPDLQVYFYKARDNEKWLFQEDGFLRYYSGNSVAHVNYITDPRQVPLRLLAEGKTAIYALGSSREVNDLTGEAKRYFGLH